ncbi:MAG: hypothetical protein U0790_26630 [Isosphaeraceae bacterium]
MAKKAAAKAAGTNAETSGNEGSQGAAISKAEAVRRMLADGIDNPSQGSQEIKARFGMDVTPQHFSATKAQIKNRKGGASLGRRGRRPKAAVEGYLAPPSKIRPTGEGDLIDTLETLKPLVAQLGTDKVHRLIDLLG